MGTAQKSDTLRISRQSRPSVGTTPIGFVRLNTKLHMVLCHGSLSGPGGAHFAQPDRQAQVRSSAFRRGRLNPPKGGTANGVSPKSSDRTYRLRVPCGQMAQSEFNGVWERGVAKCKSLPVPPFLQKSGPLLLPSRPATIHLGTHLTIPTQAVRARDPVPISRAG